MQGKLRTHFSQMCSMPSCVSTTLLKAKCKSSDALYTASTNQTVKNIDGSGCQLNDFRKRLLSISKHRKIQASATSSNVGLGNKLHDIKVQRTKQKAANAGGLVEASRNNCENTHILTDALKLQHHFLRFVQVQMLNYYYISLYWV